MNVYRVESKVNGKGPFQNGVAPLSAYGNLEGPAWDGVFGSYEDYWDLLKNNPDELYAHSYGFCDKQQLLDTFDIDSLVPILKKDHVVAKYEVPDDKVKLGGQQCAFKKEDAKLKAWVPVRELMH